MNVVHHGVKVVDLPDDWWDEAGMAGFIPVDSSYVVDDGASDGQPAFRVRVDDVAPVRRNPGIRIFNDDRETGLTARERVVSILKAFRTGAPLPPVKVVRMPDCDAFRYKLVAGVHRFHCSLAVGFQTLPAIEGFDWASLDV